MSSSSGSTPGEGASNNQPEGFYKEYSAPDGRKIQITKEQFNQVVEFYRWLLERDQSR